MTFGHLYWRTLAHHINYLGYNGRGTADANFLGPNPISSIPKVVIFRLRALMAPLNEGLRGGIPVGVSEMTQGMGNFII